MKKTYKHVFGFQWFKLRTPVANKAIFSHWDNSATVVGADIDDGKSMIQCLHSGRECEGHLLPPSHAVLPLLVPLQHVRAQLPLHHSVSSGYDHVSIKTVSQVIQILFYRCFRTMVYVWTVSSPNITIIYPLLYLGYYYIYFLSCSIFQEKWQISLLWCHKGTPQWQHHQPRVLYLPSADAFFSLIPTCGWYNRASVLAGSSKTSFTVLLLHFISFYFVSWQYGLNKRPFLLSWENVRHSV